jgi:hypothetical protein
MYTRPSTFVDMAVRVLNPTIVDRTGLWVTALSTRRTLGKTWSVVRSHRLPRLSTTPRRKRLLRPDSSVLQLHATGVGGHGLAVDLQHQLSHLDLVRPDSSSLS